MHDDGDFSRRLRLCSDHVVCSEGLGFLGLHGPAVSESGYLWGAPADLLAGQGRAGCICRRRVQSVSTLWGDVGAGAALQGSRTKEKLQAFLSVSLHFL